MQAYLEAYAKAHRLTELVTFRAEVKAVRPVFRGGAGGGGVVGRRDYSVWREGGEEGQDEPRWRVTFQRQQQRQEQAAASAAEAEEEEEEEFDAVVVCNGHFDVPYTPPFPGLREHYRGRVLHSRRYDDPRVCEGLRVLCVGYKSSGTDIARCVRVVRGLEGGCWCGCFVCGSFLLLALFRHGLINQSTHMSTHPTHVYAGRLRTWPRRCTWLTAASSPCPKSSKSSSRSCSAATSTAARSWCASSPTGTAW